MNELNRLELTEQQEGATGTWSVSATLDPNLDTLIQRFTYDDSGNVLARLPEFLADAMLFAAALMSFMFSVAPCSQ